MSNKAMEEKNPNDIQTADSPSPLKNRTRIPDWAVFTLFLVLEAFSPVSFVYWNIYVPGEPSLNPAIIVWGRLFDLLAGYSNSNAVLGILLIFLPSIPLGLPSLVVLGRRKSWNYFKLAIVILFLSILPLVVLAALFAGCQNCS
jgi:hypothetical protein